MKEIASVSFKQNGRKYYFDLNGINIKKGDEVIVETERGTQYGFVAKKENIEETELRTPLKCILRLATSTDKKTYDKNIEDAKKALKKCRSLAQKYKLNMYILDATFTFNREQLLFNFLADNRIDFRSLAKELASIYHTRIELRQIGVRDKAKELGGIGMCGRSLCCSNFMCDFDSVSINMAKNQNIALNPSKINGVCGRLLCCLKYEDDMYLDARRKCPKIGSKYNKNGHVGTVKSVDLLNQKIKVEVKENTIEEIKID